jgi:ribosome biogenesis GTPase
MGLETIEAYLTRGQTAVFVGSSGVGKSTIISALAGAPFLPVRPVRVSDDRGRHTTTSRQMVFLPQGGIVIDTPGMRELQLWDGEEGVRETFEDISALAQRCRFRDCRHRSEPGCEVERAILSGRLEPQRLENQRKLEAELLFQEGKLDPEVARRAKEQRKRIHKEARRHKTSRS